MGMRKMEAPASKWSRHTFARIGMFGARREADLPRFHFGLGQANLPDLGSC